MKFLLCPPTIAIFLGSVLFMPALHTQPLQPDSLTAINLDAINSTDFDGFATLSPDGRTLYFTSRTAKAEEMWKSVRKPDGTWDQPLKDSLFATLSGTGGVTFDDSAGIFASAVGYSKNNRPTAFLYGMVSGKMVRLSGEVNTDKWQAQPSVSSDGRKLFFCSNRDSGMQIYVSCCAASGAWLPPTNLGGRINSMGVAMSPCYHSADSLLLFAATLGSGKVGIHAARWLGPTDTDWTNPIVVPAPINEKLSNSISPFLSRDGRELFFASDRIGGRGKYDIYLVRLPRGIQKLLSTARR